MVDRVIAAARIASIRDAIARIGAVLPKDRAAFLTDRTAREVVVLNLFVALQNALDLAAHWLADAGRPVPTAYRDLFLRLGEDGMLEPGLAVRLAAASGFRNLVAHHYGAIDPERVFEIATHDLKDLAVFCDALAAAC